MLTQRQQTLLRRFLMGEVPRCSIADFRAIDDHAPGVFNLEGVEGLHGPLCLVALKRLEHPEGFAEMEAKRLLGET